MAQGRRVERVAALIRKETSELLINGIRDERVHIVCEVCSHEGHRCPCKLWGIGTFWYYIEFI